MNSGVIPVDIVVRKPSLRYLNQFVRQFKSAADMLLAGLFPDAKEITESCGAFEAVVKRARRMWGKDCLQHPDTTVVAVGDGCTPRTAGLFAFRSAWTCDSVDPQLNAKSYHSIQRLHVHRVTIEEYMADYKRYRLVGFRPTHLVVVAVHSHAPLECVAELDPDIVVAIPCCVPQTFSADGYHYAEHRDVAILSQHNIVKTWWKEPTCAT